MKICATKLQKSNKYLIQHKVLPVEGEMEDMEVTQLEVRLFRKSSINYDGESFDVFNSQKVQELFYYLLLFHDQAHHREKLADIVWGHSNNGEPRKNLRKTLYKLKKSLGSIQVIDDREIIQSEQEWLEIKLAEFIWLDVAEFETVFDFVSGIRGRELDERQFVSLQEAIQIYQGDLLEGCYQDWCIFERDRYREIFFSMLNKMIGYCEVTNRFDLGIKYGNEILRHERANERTHRRLMRLHYLAGDRTAALKQYERLKVILEQELTVKPGKRTAMLFQQILSDKEESKYEEYSEGEIAKTALEPNIKSSLARIKKMISQQVSDQQRLLREIQELVKNL